MGTKSGVGILLAIFLLSFTGGAWAQYEPRAVEALLAGDPEIAADPELGAVSVQLENLIEASPTPEVTAAELVQVDQAVEAAGVAGAGEPAESAATVALETALAGNVAAIGDCYSQLSSTLCGVDPAAGRPIDFGSPEATRLMETKMRELASTMGFTGSPADMEKMFGVNCATDFAGYITDISGAPEHIVAACMGDIDKFIEEVRHDIASHPEFAEHMTEFATHMGGYDVHTGGTHGVEYATHGTETTLEATGQHEVAAASTTETAISACTPTETQPCHIS